MINQDINIDTMGIRTYLIICLLSQLVKDLQGCEFAIA